MKTGTVLLLTTAVTAGTIYLLMNKDKQSSTGTQGRGGQTATDSMRIMSGQNGWTGKNNPPKVDELFSSGNVSKPVIAGRQMGGANFGAANKYNSGIRNISAASNGQGGLNLQSMPAHTGFDVHDERNARALVNRNND